MIRRTSRYTRTYTLFPYTALFRSRLSVSPRSERSRRKRDGRRMTYGLGIRVADGLVCLADVRTTSGNQVTSAQNLSLHGSGAAQFAIMTSGLRALRDKTLAYFERDLRRNHPAGFATMLDAVSAYCH